MEARLAEYEIEFIEELTAGCLTEDGIKSDHSIFEFACDDNKCD